MPKTGMGIVRKSEKILKKSENIGKSRSLADGKDKRNNDTDDEGRHTNGYIDA